MEEKPGLKEGICSPFAVAVFGASLTRSPGKLVGRGVVLGTLGLHLVSRKHSDDLGPLAGV